MAHRVKEETMDCSSSDISGHQEVQTQEDLDLQQLTKKIKVLMDKQLNHECNKKLRFLHQCSFYLDVQHGDFPQSVVHQNPHCMDSFMWSMIDQQRLNWAISFCHTRVQLLLTTLGLLSEQLSKSYVQLSAFMEKHSEGLLSREEAASAQRTMEQTLKYASDFNHRILHIQGPLNLQVKFIPNTGALPFPRLITSLMIKLPVVINRSASSATSSSVVLFWSITGTEDQDPYEQFEVQVGSLHPTIGEDKFRSLTSQRFLEVKSLTPERCYQLSVKRADAVNLVYGLWTDSIIMRTLKVSRSRVKV